MSTLLQQTNKFAACGVPFIISPSGSMGNNGAITSGTALATTYANAYVYLPANAIVAGSTAGWYFAQFTSTTAGTVYNNTYTSGQPTIPATLVPFVTTGPGSYTGVTTQVTAQNFQIDQGTLGPNGVLRMSVYWNMLNNVNTKTLGVTLGSSTIGAIPLTSTGSANTIFTVYNQGTTATQASFAVASNSGVGTANSNLLHTTAANLGASSPSTSVALLLTMATATDFLGIEGFLAEFFYGA
jgi:hypothetical protein